MYNAGAFNERPKWEKWAMAFLWISVLYIIIKTIIDLSL